jgi:hypothetical protein
MDEYIKREDALDAVLFALVGTGYQSRAIDAIRDIPSADVVPKSEVARCKDCIYFQPDFVLQNGERRPYTEEEIKNGKLVTGDVGINCGSRCERFGYWEENKIPVWFNENDYCSYFKKKYTESEGEE